MKKIIGRKRENGMVEIKLWMKKIIFVSILKRRVVKVGIGGIDRFRMRVEV